MDTNGKIVVEGFDWGPAVTKAIIKIGEDFDRKGNTDAGFFEVKEIRKNRKKSFLSDRIITDVYYSNEKGERIETKGEYVSLNLKFNPEEGVPMFYDIATDFNRWFDYELIIKTADGEEIRLNNDNFVFPETEGVDLGGRFTGSKGHTLTYASFKPQNASAENERPLVIWLHGMGEGGTDPLIALYGNRVTALFKEEFQKITDGAYVLVPQNPTMWLQHSDKVKSWLRNRGKDSIYLEDLKELIDKFVSENHVDKKRIIVGGCSNGGFMTVNLILKYPDYFAAAFPICEAYYPKKLKAEQILSIKDLPLWFIYAKNDRSVSPGVYTKPLLKLLEKAGAENVIVSEFDDVHDTSGLFEKDGKPYNYFGHFSWIYFFNNECVDKNVSIWEWIAQRSR